MRLLSLALAALGVANVIRAQEELFDRVRDALTFNTPSGDWRGRLSGTFELEYYRFDAPAPGLLYTTDEELWAPRVPLFVDVQYGSAWYAFAQVRLDRGFDPSEGAWRGRLDEYALRWSAPDGVINVQAGKFATVVGNWASRHGAWENPFITAPLPYENLTPMWDGTAVRTTSTLLRWAHIRPLSSAAEQSADKHQRVPLIWGPSYAAGAAISGRIDKVGYAVELKNAGLSSRPSTWSAEAGDWRHPTLSGRLSYHPSPTWGFGVSASTGPYLQPLARATLAPGAGLGDYYQRVFGVDAAFAWHRTQIWAELYESTFHVPRLGDARTVAGYVEGKYKFTPQLFGSVRWGEQRYGSLPEAGTSVRWGRDIWRGEVGLGYRFNASTQLKWQVGVQHEAFATQRLAALSAWQFVLRF